MVSSHIENFYKTNFEILFYLYKVHDSYRTFIRRTKILTMFDYYSTSVFQGEQVSQETVCSR